MNDFYIFLDIDGVLYDWQYIKNFSEKRSKIIKNFNPVSVNALNNLINFLKCKYNVILVITSTWRKNMEKCISILNENNVDLNKLNKICSTKISKTQNLRALEIIEFCKENLIRLDKNYVIIDDEMFDYITYFNKDNIIKTNIFNGSLNMTHVNNFIQNLSNSYEK